jgi:hypothetical protein
MQPDASPLSDTNVLISAPVTAILPVMATLPAILMARRSHRLHSEPRSSP